MTVSIVFFSGLRGEGFKAPRLRGYLRALHKRGLPVRFFGLPKAEHERPKWPAGVEQWFASTRAKQLAEIGKEIGSPLGKSSVGRYLATRALCEDALKEGCLENTKVLFTQIYMWPLVREARRRGIPVIVESDSDYPEHLWKVLQERHRVNRISFRDKDTHNFYPYVKMALRSIKTADRVVVFSEHARSTFIAAGIDERRLLMSRPPPSAKCSVAKDASETPEFIWSGNHGVRKGLDLVRDAWRLHKEGGGAGLLHICGSVSPSQKRLRQEISQLPDVHDHGKIALIDFLSERRRILVMPSFSEGLPRTLTETMACGGAAIASVPAAGGLVVDDETGWLVDLTAEDLCRAIQRASDNWHCIHTMGDAAAAKVRSETDGFFRDVSDEICEFHSRR